MIKSSLKIPYPQVNVSPAQINWLNVRMRIILESLGFAVSRCKKVWCFLGTSRKEDSVLENAVNLDKLMTLNVWAIKKNKR